MFFLHYISIVLTSCDEATSQNEDTALIQEVNPDLDAQDIEPVPIVGELPIFGDKEIWVDALIDEESTPYRISGTRLLLHTDGEALLFDEATDTITSLGTFDQIEGVQLDVQRSMILLDGTAFVFDGTWLEESPLNDIPVSYTHLTLPTIYSV